MLNSSLQNIEIFSSKLKTCESLKKKKKINTINIEKELKENIKYVSKPEFGAGSTNIIIFTKKEIKLKTRKKRLYKNIMKEKREFCHVMLQKRFSNYLL